MAKNIGFATKLRKLDENTLKVLAALCRGPEEGRQPGELWEEVKSEMGKGTFYKRLETLMNELKCINLVQHPTDRRKVFYRIRPDHLLLCQEQAAGFEVFRLMRQTRLRSLDPNTPGRPKALSIGTKKAMMVVFTDKNLDTKPMNNLLEDETFKSDLERAIGNLFQKLSEGVEGDATDSKSLIAFYPEEAKSSTQK